MPAVGAGSLDCALKSAELVETTFTRLVNGRHPIVNPTVNFLAAFAAGLLVAATSCRIIVQVLSHPSLAVYFYEFILLTISPIYEGRFRVLLDAFDTRRHGGI